MRPKTTEWSLRLPMTEAQERVARAMRSIDMEIEEQPGSVTGTAARSVRKNRWAATVIVRFQPAESGSTALVSVDMAGTKHAAIMQELAAAIGPDLVAKSPQVVSDAERTIARLAQKLNMKLAVRKELRALPSMLSEGEEVVNLTQGRYEGNAGLIVATDRRVMFIDEGVVRSHREDFPYERISSIQCSTGLMSGKLTIFASGNKAELDNILPKQQAISVADYVRTRIAVGSSPSAMQASQSPAAPQLDAFTKLQKLGELRDAGLLTAEEFDAKKAALLAEM